MYDKKFDPLGVKYGGNEEVLIKSIKRELQNILSSYVGWFDPFCELIQNALDALDARAILEKGGYQPQIHVLINIKDNIISVTDNGIGFEEQQYTKFLAPNFSFKSGNTRGHKGVGSTYLAYGFNYIQIATSSPTFKAIGTMKGAKCWLSDENPAGNPEVIPDDSDPIDSFFTTVDRGVSMSIKYDEYTVPKDLSWIKVKSAENWMELLRIKTGLGAIKSNDKINVTVTVISKTGIVSETTHKGISYLSANEFLDKTAKYTDILIKMDELYKKKGPDYNLPSKYTNLNAIFDTWTSEKLATEIQLDKSDLDILDRYKPTTYFCYVYSTKIWDKLNEKLGLRGGINAMTGGIQLAANNMPQGELLLIPLKKNAGRQFQLHVVMHFENCSADLGRKGFQKEIVDFSKEAAKKIADGPLMKVKKYFRKNTGSAPDLLQQQKLDAWKLEMKEHETDHPLLLQNPNFFMPSNKISMTSTPTREQDVIALFNQLLAGGVIRGIKIMSTNERFTYDGLFRIVMETPFNNHIYDKEKNPLGVSKENIDDVEKDYNMGFLSEPKVLEYKFSLDGLIEDINNGTKASKDINLVIAWEAGEMFREKFYLKSMLLWDNLSLRQYHGVTHRMYDNITNEPLCDIILLQDLIKYLNDQDECQEDQLQYEE